MSSRYCLLPVLAAVVCSLVGCTAAQVNEYNEAVARQVGSPTNLENELREKVLAGTATPEEYEVWRVEVASRTAIRTGVVAQQAEVRAAIASRSVVAQPIEAQTLMRQPMMEPHEFQNRLPPLNMAPATKTVSHFHNGGVTNHTITDTNTGHTTIQTW